MVRESALHSEPSRTIGTHMPVKAAGMRVGRVKPAAKARQYVPDEQTAPVGPGVHPMRGAALVIAHLPRVVEPPSGRQA